ncbi:galactose-binding domain-containing protein [Aquipuribacter sp. MA13-6]|uniref:galactose-binding domain-containing protein n=1 Tax=unclassified Aquipuribacter TaxID=2635084 RepID=UPI003EE8ED75
MSGRRRRTAVAGAVVGALVGSLVGLTPTAAQTVPPVLPENMSDIGVYTDGLSSTMDIGDPTYQNADLVQQRLEPGVPWTAGSMHQSIFEQDLAAGGTDYYLDRVLGVQGTTGNNVLQTRGRTLYMRGAGGANFSTMGFAGTAYAGGPNNLGNFYTVTVPGQTVTEVGAQRFNAPSHAKSQYTVGSTGVTADQKKFITHDNVAVTALTFTNPGSSEVTFTVRAASPLATTTTDSADELTGTRTLTSGANNGLVDTPWSRVTIGLKAAGFERSGSALDRVVTVPAGGSVDLSVVGVLRSDSMPASEEAFYDYAEMTPPEAFRTAVTAFNRQWAADIPYIDVPSPGVEKAIVYRWWGERYNVLDANEPGYVYQYPTTIEGVNLYQNSVVLTQPMHLQDTKWIRNPYLGYGQILNVGELSGSSALLDSPGHTSWNNHYSQYMGTAGLEAFNVHGGGAQVAERFGHYFEWDGKGQLEHYDGNDDGLIAYDTNYMPGNDSDAISFGYPKVNAGAPGARTIERPESAYVWGAFDAASQLYEIAGAEETKVAEMDAEAARIQDAVLDRLWSEEMRMFLAGTSHGARSGGALNPLSEAERDLIPARESNLYDIYAENMIPFEDAEEYVDGFRFLTYGDNFPIFPFYTANQYDKTKYGIGGSNNFSNINFTVQYRAVRSALRHYDPEGKYLDEAYAARLLDWMAWSIYPGGNTLVPNQSEYFSNWNPTTQTYNRNNPNHVMLGNMNYIYVEDMGGIQPRSDDLIELWPIDLGYEHFMVNNLRYHGEDITIVWDEDGSEYGLGAGYSLFIDGEKKAVSEELGRFVYDPNAHEVVEQDEGLVVDVVGEEGTSFATAVDTPIEDPRVVEYLKTAGVDLEEDAVNLATDATLSSSATQDGPRATPWRQFHTPGWSSSSMNHTPGAISTTERAVSLDAVTDGVTVNEPYWGNSGTEGATGWVELDLGEATTLDNVKTWFVSDRQAGGYKEPARWSVQVPDGSGGWVNVADQFKAPKVPAAKFNESLFDTVTTDRLRVSFTNAPGHFTAISEIQVFDSGRDVPEVVNDPPTVTVTVDGTRDGNLSTGLVATAIDDGVPDDGELTYGWEVVSAPEDAGVIFSAPRGLSTLVTGTVEGEYVIRFRAHDGELTTVRDVTLTLTPKEMSAEFGASATISTSGASPWENPLRVNEATTPPSSAPGAGNGWGNWGQQANGTSLARQAWIRYAWDSPVLMTSTDIYWYDDNGGVRIPRPDTYVVEYSTDGTEWSPVTLAEGSTYADSLDRSAYNRIEFEPVRASYLRIRIFGAEGNAGGTGVLRWRVNGDTVETVASPVIMRTPTGVVPELPGQLDVVYSGGESDELPFVWQEITPAMVAETNVEPFLVYGTNSTYGLIAEAQIYVRPENSPGGISIQGAEQFERTVEIGELPDLPERVLVSYNDGSRDNQAIGVDWDLDPEVVQTPGTYVVEGDLVLPFYVSTAGTIATTLTLTVLPAAGVESVTVSPATATVLPGATQQFTAEVVVRREADDSVTWSVTGAEAAGTTVDGSGLLSVAADETGRILTVTATSVFDDSVQGSASVSTAEPGPEWETEVSLLDVLGQDTSGPEAPTRANGDDFDLLTFAVQRVLTAKPGSPVGVLGDPEQPLTAFLPDDDAFMASLEELLGSPVRNEKIASGRIRTALTVDQLEAVLLDHVVLDATLVSEDVLGADGAQVTTAAGTVLTVQVDDDGIALLDADGSVVAVVDLDRVDVNLGQVQVAHVIDRVVITG